MIEYVPRINDILRRMNDCDVSRYDDVFLKASLEKRVAGSGCGSAEEYTALLERSDAERIVIVDSLQICYSEFFRNPLTYAVLERIVLPALAAQKRTSRQKELRVWSAACAGGQEAYSLAMLLEELRSTDSQQFRYRIFATDHSETQVIEAEGGHYTSSALGNLSLKRVNRWFTRQGDTYSIATELRQHIDFSVFDLFNQDLNCPPASIFGDFDLIVCSNLLFYYKYEYRMVILDKIAAALAKNGYLVTGETERDMALRGNFQELFPQSAILKRKTI
jgi:chemotaxis methyl-accepting protein methylase